MKRALACSWLIACYLAPSCAHNPLPASPRGLQFAATQSPRGLPSVVPPRHASPSGAAVTISGADPVDGSAAVNRVRLRDGSSILSRTTSAAGSVEAEHLRDASRSSGEAGPAADALVLVRMWVAESRWRRFRDHAAQSWIVQRWAARMGFTLAVAVELRVWRFSSPPRWVRHIEPACSEPAGWPARYSWGAHADDCRQLFARADAFLRGDVGDPCEGRARGWRAPGPALEAAIALGREQVWCLSLIHI